MMQFFDISELPEKITTYRNEVLSEALSRNSQYLQQMWQGATPEQHVVLWQELAQDAVNAMGSYMEPRVDSLEEGDDPRLVFYESDESEPIRSYVAAWIEGYATCVLGGRCSEGEIRPTIEQSGVSLYPMDNRVAYAETVLPRRGYNEECVSVAIGHAILSYTIGLSGEIPEEERVRFNWMGDIDGFADGWRCARRDGLGAQGGDYVPYSEENQIDEFMRQIEEESERMRPDEANATKADVDDGGMGGTADDGVTDGTSPDDGLVVSADEFEDVTETELAGISQAESERSQGRELPSLSETTGESLPEMYSSVLSGVSDHVAPDTSRTGIFIEVIDEGDDSSDGKAEATGIIPAGDSAVFTAEDLDEFEDVTEEEILRIKTKIDAESATSLTGSFVAIVPKDENTEGDPEVKERTLRRLPPIFEKYLMLSVSNSLRGNASRIAELTEAGMTFEQSDRLRRKLMSATAKYGLKELAQRGLEDGIPAGDDGTEPVRTYANSWIQGYISVITDGDNSQSAIVRAAMMSVIGSDDITDDVAHVIERQEWEGYDDECSMVTVAHLRVSLSAHSHGHPLAHPMEGSRKFSRRGATDGFSDGWWRAMEVLRRISEAAEEGRQIDLPTPEGGGTHDKERPKDSQDGAGTQSTSDIEKAKEEAKTLLAGLFVEDDLLPETSVNDLIGAPRPMANPDRARMQEQTPRASDVAGGGQERRDAFEPMRVPQEGQRAPLSQSQLVAESTPQHPQPRQQQPQPTREERIRQHASQCAVEAVKQNSGTVKWLWAETGLQKDGATTWTNAVKRATAAYGWHVVNDLRANPAKGHDGTRPMLSYAIGWIVGYAIGSGGAEMSDRDLERMSRELGLSFGDIGERCEYVRRTCSSKGYGQECMMTTLRRMKGMYLAHDKRNPKSANMPDNETYNWIADADGYSDGWVIASRVRAQQQGTR